MLKTACIFSFKLSNWVSCQKIVFNIHKSYQLNRHIEIKNFNFSDDLSSVELLKLANSLVAYRPDVIVLMDHNPHPLELLLITLPKLEKLSRIIFHIYGDFSLFYPSWEKLGKILTGIKVDFIVASDRQKILFDRYLPDHIRSYVCPFPVNRDEFYFDKELRTSQRKKWGIEENDIIFLYSGRLSSQKRIHFLLTCFNEFCQSHKISNAHLFLYGSTDYVADQFIGKIEVDGEYFRKINRIYISLPADIQSKIHFMGSVKNDVLKNIYNAADYLINLSVHNDEDFGMSVAEAHCSGLPSLLTDWGGFSSFTYKELPEATQFVPVTIGEKSKIVNHEGVLKVLEGSLHQGHFKHREKLSQLAGERFSIEACAKVIEKILQTPPKEFTDWSPFFHKVVHQQLFSEHPYLDESNNINHLYREIYSAYVRNN